MMTPEQDAEVAGDDNKLHNERATSADNGNQREERDRSPVRHARRQSEAERRDDREHQRAENHQAKARLSILNNRFLTCKESKGGPDSPRQQAAEKSDRGTPTKRPQQPEENKDSDDEEESQPRVVEENALVVTRRKSSAMSSVNGQSKHERRPSSTARGASTSARQESLDVTKIITTPSVHMLPSLALRRSKWTRELDEDATCGLFVDEEQREIQQVPASTLVRLEERLQREELLTVDSQNSAKLRLNDLIQTIQRTTEDSGNNNPLDQRISMAIDDSDARPLPLAIALLEVVIDRIILDDHVSFTLADRLETQIRSVYASYTQLLHAQPWRVLLQRIDAFVDAHLQSHIPPQTAQSVVSWHHHTTVEVQDLLQSLSGLQQLHYQLLGKWHELQDCYRQPSMAVRPASMRLDIQQRATPLTLEIVHAFLDLEVPTTKANHDDESAARRGKLTKRLDELETKDQYLHSVLVLSAPAASVPSTQPVPTPSTPRIATSWTCLPSIPSLFSPPKVYAVLLVNGNEVGRTRACSWSTSTNHRAPSVGVVVFREALRARLQYFPSSAAINVYERGVLFDTMLSTTAIPLLMPGFDLVNQVGGHGDSQPIAAASLAPSCEWYQFSSVRSVPRSHWHPTFLNASGFATFERRPHGRVHVQVSWVTNAPSRPLETSSDNQQTHDADHSEAWLPPRRLAVATAHSDTRLVGPRVDCRFMAHDTNASERYGRGQQAYQRTGFSYERDFLVHVADSNTDAIDRLDPQNAAVVRLQDHVANQSALLRHRNVFRTSALAFDASLTPTPWCVGGRAALTNRNLLLQLRDRKHVAAHGTSVTTSSTTDTSKRKPDPLFDEPLPLMDGEILTNAKFLSLLRPELPAFVHRQQVDDALAAGDRFSIERHRRLQLLKLHDFVERVKVSHVGAASTKKAADTTTAASHRSKSLTSIIQEQPLPLLPGDLDLSGLLNMFAPRRRLRPRVEKRTAPATKADWPRSCTLYVQIKSATNVPVRVATTLPKPEAAGDDSSDNSSHVFVEISFQGRRRRTTSTYARPSTGAVWMESISLPFLAPRDDWSPDALQQTQDVIYLSLFDQLVHAGSSSSSVDDDTLLLLNRKGSDDDRTTGVSSTHDRKQSFHQENRYLGRLEIPFTTLYHNHGTLDAMLRCEMPIANLGYANVKHSIEAGVHSDDPTVGSTAIDDDGVAQSSREATFLSVMMTLDPLLPLPLRPFTDAHVMTTSGETSSSLAAYARQWASATQQQNASTKHRDFDVFVRNLSHGQTFLTRYVTPQTPPTLLAGDKTPHTVSQLVHFVRLIPFLDDWQLFDGVDVDVWTTSQELLDLNAGDFDEHAVLLCNYLQWLDRHESNRKCYLLLATAVPEGKTVYVLCQDTYKIPQRSVAWNASTGVGYSVLDDRCPLLDVSLAVSSENVYANIQPNRRPSEMNWDIETNTKSWKPFFHSGFKRDSLPLSPVQPRDLDYIDTPIEYSQQVELELKETLKLEIRRWRSVKYTTTFHIDLSMKLRGSLERLEASMRDRTDLHNKRRSKETDPINELIKTRRVSGMPLQTSFTDIAKVVGMVKNTNIYWNDHSDVEFGLAVYVHAYPNYVLSVWVYLVAIEPRD